MTMSSQSSNIKHVFVCGLPRSGTSLLGRNVARLEGCTGFKNTGVLEDEGQFLQDVYRSDHEIGGAGAFGFHPDAHLTEASPLLTPRNAERLRRCWERYWDTTKRLRIEKTPANLLMTRFLQAIFPNAYFVVIKRHPIAVSMATQKWKDSVRSLDYLFRHWLHCHQLFEQDKKYLNHVYELRYEDYVNDSERFHSEIAAFIGTHVPMTRKEETFRSVRAWRKPAGRQVPEYAMESTNGAHNQRYFDRWTQLVRESPFRSYYLYLAARYEPRFAMWGYSIVDGFNLGSQAIALRKSRKVVGPLLCTGADAIALSRRFLAHIKEFIRITAKKVLPELIINKIRSARQEESVESEKRNVLLPQVVNR